MVGEACGAGGMYNRGSCVAGGGMHGRRNGHCSRWYASYWHAFLYAINLHGAITLVNVPQVDTTRIIFNAVTLNTFS